MEKNSYDLEFEITGTHWWFASRRKLLHSLLSSVSIRFQGPILDIGCGVGSNLPVLQSHRWNAIGIDQSFYALSLASKRFKIPLVNGDINQLPIKPNSVGLIIASDILEHLDDDLNGIRELYQSLLKRGILILTVPAFRFLWGTQDVVTGHKRRYSRRQILDKLNQAGFDIMRSSYFNFFLFFPILLARILIRLLGLHLESENRVNSHLINFLLKRIFSLEPFLLKYFTFPFGVSIFCIAKK
jgi:SAM-dependent methyltransferase